MAQSIRRRLLVVGLIGVVLTMFGFLTLVELRPFGVLPPILEGAGIAPIIAMVVLLNIVLQSKFDVDRYVRERGRRYIVFEFIRIALACAFFGIAIGLILGYTGLGQLFRVGIVFIIEYFAGFFIFAMANADFYDDERFRELVSTEDS